MRQSDINFRLIQDEVVLSEAEDRHVLNVFTDIRNFHRTVDDNPIHVLYRVVSSGEARDSPFPGFDGDVHLVSDESARCGIDDIG